MIPFVIRRFLPDNTYEDWKARWKPLNGGHGSRLRPVERERVSSRRAREGGMGSMAAVCGFLVTLAFLLGSWWIQMVQTKCNM